MNDNLLKSPFGRKTCPKCRQQNPLVEYITKELKSNKPKHKTKTYIINEW